MSNSFNNKEVDKQFLKLFGDRCKQMFRLPKYVSVPSNLASLYLFILFKQKDYTYIDLKIGAFSETYSLLAFSSVLIDSNANDIRNYDDIKITDAWVGIKDVDYLVVVVKFNSPITNAVVDALVWLDLSTCGDIEKVMIDDIDIPTVYTEWDLSTLASPRNLTTTPFTIVDADGLQQSYPTITTFTSISDSHTSDLFNEDKTVEFVEYTDYELSPEYTEVAVRGDVVGSFTTDFSQLNTQGKLYYNLTDPNSVPLTNVSDPSFITVDNGIVVGISDVSYLPATTTSIGGVELIDTNEDPDLSINRIPVQLDANNKAFVDIEDYIDIFVGDIHRYNLLDPNTPSAYTLRDLIIQHIGPTSQGYVNGYFYKSLQQLIGQLIQGDEEFLVNALFYRKFSDYSTTHYWTSGGRMSDGELVTHVQITLTGVISTPYKITNVDDTSEFLLLTELELNDLGVSYLPIIGVSTGSESVDITLLASSTYSWVLWNVQPSESMNIEYITTDDIDQIVL